MKKKWTSLVLATCLSTALVGCAGNENDQAANDRNGNDNIQLTRVGTNNGGNGNENQTDQELRVSTRAARNIERMDQVDQAHVIIRNNDAYVAVRLNNEGNNGNNGNGNENGRNNGDGGIRATDNTDMRDAGGNTNNTGIAGDGRAEDNIGTADINGNGNNTDTAGNDNNAGAERTRYSEVSTAFEQKIADQVRAADKNIHKVYVSVDRDFYDQMTNYTDDIRNGRDNDGLFEDFTGTIRDVFQ